MMYNKSQSGRCLSQVPQQLRVPRYWLSPSPISYVEPAQAGCCGETAGLSSGGHRANRPNMPSGQAVCEGSPFSWAGASSESSETLLAVGVGYEYPWQVAGVASRVQCRVAGARTAEWVYEDPCMWGRWGRLPWPPSAPPHCSRMRTAA